MSSNQGPRLFSSSDEIRSIGERLLSCTLPRAEWTHEAHLAATTYLAAERPDIDLKEKLPDIIRRYNVSVGGINDETQGYHDTITAVFLAGVYDHLHDRRPDEDLVETVNKLLQSEQGRRDWPLQFYSEPYLFSVEARLRFVKPDLRPLP